MRGDGQKFSIVPSLRARAVAYLDAKAETEGHGGDDEDVGNDGEDDGATSWAFGIRCKTRKKKHKLGNILADELSECDTETPSC